MSGGDNAKGELQEWCQRARLQLPSYNSETTGPTNSPTFVCTVTERLRSGETLRERVERRGCKKRDVEHIAARKMLQRLQEPTAEGAMAGAMASPNSRGVSRPRRLSDVSSSPVAAALARASLSPRAAERSPVSLLQEHLQAEGSPLPNYTETAPSPRMPFRVRCSLHNTRRQLVMETQGEGQNKQSAKNDAARKMLTRIESGRVVSDPPGVRGHSNGATNDPPGVDDQDLDDDIATNLSRYSPQYHFWHAPGQAAFFCLATAEGVASYPITGHGMGEEEGVAKREASLNLLACIAALT